MNVYLLWHMRPVGDVAGVDREMVDVETEDKLCGVFSSEETAKAARSQLTLQPGFRDHPNDFFIGAAEVDAIEWSEGFVTEAW